MQPYTQLSPVSEKLGKSDINSVLTADKSDRRCRRLLFDLQDGGAAEV